MDNYIFQMNFDSFPAIIIRTADDYWNLEIDASIIIFFLSRYKLWFISYSPQHGAGMEDYLWIGCV